MSSILLNSKFSAIDAAILPFIRQFSMVDLERFNSLSHIKVKQWLKQCLAKDEFVNVMTKYAIWQKGDDKVIFAEK